MTPIRWGILGAAKFAREFMAPAIHAARGAEFAALATSSADKAAPFLAFQPHLTVHPDYDALLADPRIDAVYIPLPNHMHVEWSLKALAAGKHVLCEKPMAMTEPEFDSLIAARDRAGKLAAEAYMIVHHPQWQRVKELLQDGAIGPLVHVDAAFSFDNRADTGNIRNKAETGGGGLRDIGVYTMGSVRYVTGAEPETLDARIRWENGVDVFAQVSAQFQGFSYNGYTSIRMHPWQQMIFHGEAGLLRLTAPFNPQVFGEARIEIHQQNQSVRIERYPVARHYVLQVEAFCDAARTGGAYAVPLEFSRGTQAMIDRAFDAAQTSK